MSQQRWLSPFYEEVIVMDFSAWSASHTILTLLIVMGFIAQVALLFYRAGQLDKRLDTQADSFDRLEGRINTRSDRLDKQIEVVDKRMDEKSFNGSPG